MTRLVHRINFLKIAVVVFTACALSSCQKEYTCHCGFYDMSVYAYSHEKAKKLCEKNGSCFIEP